MSKQARRADSPGPGPHSEQTPANSRKGSLEGLESGPVFMEDSRENGQTLSIWTASQMDLVPKNRGWGFLPLPLQFREHCVLTLFSHGLPQEARSPQSLGNMPEPTSPSRPPPPETWDSNPCPDSPQPASRALLCLLHPQGKQSVNVGREGKSLSVQPRV